MLQGIYYYFLKFIFIFRSKAIHKVDIPAFNWPIANFPRYKYPLHCNESYNKKQDEDCLKNVTKLIFQQKNANNDVAAVIVEPIQSEGGDHISSSFFFHGLQAICKENGVVFIVDEVNFCYLYKIFLKLF